MQRRLVALKALINFAQDGAFIEQLCQLGTVNRVYDILKENVRQDLKNAELETEEQSQVKLLAEGVFELVGGSSGDLQEATIMHCFLLLNNLSAIENGQKHILCLDNEKSQFIIVESLFAMFCYFNKNTAFDFVSNLMANIACLNEGRQWMLDNGMFEAISLQLLTKQPNTHRRKSLIQCLRHLSFEYEKYEARFLDKNVPRDLCKLLIDE